MFSKIKDFILTKYYRSKFKSGFVPELQKDTDYTFGGFFDVFGKQYTPKYIRVDLSPQLLEIKDQKGQNSCVLESGLYAKEVDEGQLLNTSWLAAYLRQKGQMNGKGTSLSCFQDALRNVGVPDRTSPVDHTVSWEKFSSSNQLTGLSYNTAAIHKIKSSYKTTDLNNVLEQLDNRRIAQTACDWMSNWNGLGGDYILKQGGYVIGGHAIACIGYDLNYHGRKVLIIQNSFGKDWGDNGKCYVRFEDVGTILKYGFYFNTDLDKDVIGFCSMYQNRAVKSARDPKVYVIVGSKKRWIPDEALFTLLGFHDKEIFIDETVTLIPEGDNITFEELHDDIKKKYEWLLKQLKDVEYTKNRYYKYFPQVWDN